MGKLNIVEAINLALKQEMKRDRNVIIMGEDVAKDGGVFRVTDGLLKEFGEKRIFDTPLAESGIVGTAIGMAAYGLKPVAEIQFEGFMMPAVDQLLSHAARMRHRTQGKFTTSIVLRSPWGGGVKALEHHSEAPETIFIHAPGLKVVMPATPYDAKGLMVSAIRDPDPVIFFEPKKIYRAIKEEVPEKEYSIPIGKAKIAREGKDVSIITYGSSVRDCMTVAEEMNSKYDIEVIDLRTLSPMDTETIITSVKKTGRVVIVHEAPKTLGLGAEIVARINEKALLSLEAPVERVTGFDVVTPLPKLEDHNRPSTHRIARAVEKVMNF